MWPKEVIALSKGKREVRVFVERGRYVRYTYLDPETGKLVKQGKESIFLQNEKGQYEQLFIVPLKGKRNLLFKTKEQPEAVKARKVWHAKAKKALDLF